MLNEEVADRPRAPLRLRSFAQHAAGGRISGRLPRDPPGRPGRGHQSLHGRGPRDRHRPTLGVGAATRGRGVHPSCPAAASQAHAVRQLHHAVPEFGHRGDR